MGLKLTGGTSSRMCVLLFLFALLAMAPAAFAQSSGTGQIVGTVYDSGGAAVPGAKVKATGKATGLLRELETNDAGNYRFILLPPGAYTVSVTQPGFKAFKAEVNVSVGSAITVDAHLQLGQVSEVVEVQATVLIETTAVQSDALINQRSISDLPINGRRFQDFVTLTPTVQIEPSRSGISFAGQRGINANITIDGADYNQPFFGGIRGGERSNQAFSIPQEAIREFQIVPYGYSAEFGRSTGGIMNAVTKSGTNNWHGSGFYFNRNESFARKDAFNRKALDSQHQFGGSLGGPVRRDKSFVFGAYEQQLIDNPRVVAFRRLDPPFVRTAANGEAYDFFINQQQSFTQTNDAWTALGRWDEQFTSNHRVGVRYHWSKNTAANAVSTGGQISPETTSALSNNGTEGDEAHTVSGQWTGIFTSRIVNEFRAQYSRERRPRLANALIAGTSSTVGNTGTRNFLPTTQKDYRVQVSNNLNWTIGKHSIKFGGEFNHLFADQFFQFNQFGIFSVSGTNVDQVLQTMAFDGTATDFRFIGPSGVTYLVNIGNGLASMTQNEVGLYVQDAWRITPRFTLNMGFRWEGYYNPEPDTSNTALTNLVRGFVFPNGKSVDPGFIPDNLRQFMPRVGIAWDITGRGKTVIRANAGLYYARNPLLLFAGPINNFRTPAGDLSVQLPLRFTGVCPAAPAGSPAGLPANYCTTVYGQFLLANGLTGAPINLNNFALDSLPRVTPAQIQNIATALGLPFDPNQGVQPITWADDYEAPRSWQWNIAAEHELARGFSVGGDFVYINTVHLQRNIDLNLPAPIVFPATTRTTGTLTANFPADASQRPCFGIVSGTLCTPSVSQGTPSLIASVPTRARPLPTLGSVQQRESSSRAFYRGFTLRSTFRRSKYQLQTYYTVSWNYSDDDNERDAGGQSAVNSFNLQQEYGFSRLDARHLFVFNGVYELPWGFNLSALGRFRSGRAVDATSGTFTVAVPFTNTATVPATTGSVNASINNDVNGDNIRNDRPFSAPGVPFQRNGFRDRSNLSMDLRIAKRFNLPREGMFVNISVDLFNIFNFDNISYGSTNLIYGPGISPVTAAQINPNSAFRLLRDPAACLSATLPTGNKNCYSTNNSPGAPFQMQVGVRFQF